MSKLLINLILGITLCIVTSLNSGNLSNSSDLSACSFIKLDTEGMSNNSGNENPLLQRLLQLQDEYLQHCQHSHGHLTKRCLSLQARIENLEKQLTNTR
ncbi:uncharacterized protein CMU_015560 [Cryptosporidium muris RN66]|uniref:Signal peptide-containing protein n=1 Tax=Cryptosporidium muris (strain RN66) TaxID=441375 RepID=B6ACF5_CRYMR|nr:uncharacterized protein CMU_015560 [Cryptosporidium muris RN66]EEA05809.1 hypothetical protein CMU_015560 [Cryptosporidium muris RN66]|eukprot:XP_002140158.1 hypothetical protein [Cryptosporidium muris RN66]